MVVGFLGVKHVKDRNGVNGETIRVGLANTLLQKVDGEIYCQFSPLIS